MLGRWVRGLKPFFQAGRPRRLMCSNKPFKETDGESQQLKIDKESIKRKIEQIKQRSAQEKQERSEQQHPDLMPNYRIAPIPQDILKFRRESNSQGLFAYQDPAFEQKPVQLQITSYDDDSIAVNQKQFPKSLVIFPYQLFCWEVEKGSDIRLHHFDILKLITPAPDQIVVAVRDPTQLDPSIQTHLSQNFSNVDILPLFQGIATFNDMAYDRLNSVLFITVG